MTTPTTATGRYADRCAAFRALHRPGHPLLLPNAWDHASAAMFAARSYPAVGTTSLGVAAAAGLPDGAGATRVETVRLARRLRRLPVLLTVDVEAGFSDDPADVAALAVELAGLGVVGVNLEDGRPDGSVAAPETTAGKVAAVKAAVPDLFVNARTDVWWLGVPDPLDAAVERVRAYRAAGADGIFAPGTPDADTIRVLVAEVDAPLNVLYRPGFLGVDELAGLGVSRVSTGSLPFRAALGAALAGVDALTRARTGLADDRAPADPVASPGPPSYGEVQALTAGWVPESWAAFRPTAAAPGRGD
ncbi:isocitrate lyase/phosphoenolpyruvate mutase family protein [Micromonospora sp. 15K316]|uniref:isocitrate lyase/PEP mutase family protein n=1 Tax=Micromonospora sp. 15K316 TaxID=2530376 RepID=UPI001046473A|nr:isocitrate lyase/phosphoenolpyruvate mutase family protein [Micromonospora sp. 15K316]TDC30719.1 isocitrate lyase/phosphoenolpyruvate mutase family protein [Micromonospora sp. 15K316]